MIVIGFGGNVGGEDAIRERFVRAREAFAFHGAIHSASLYRTAPIGPAQDSFLNTAIGFQIDDMIPGELISMVLEIEMLLGRDRRAEERWGPRTIDLDVLAWGSRRIRTPELEVPHPRLAERRFALKPLIDLLGEDHVLPGMKLTLAALERRVADQVVELVATTW